MYHPTKSIKLRAANKLMIGVIHNRRRQPKRTLRGLRKVNPNKNNKTTVPFSSLVDGKAASFSNSAASSSPQLDNYEVSSSSSSSSPSSTTTTSPQDDHHNSVSEGEPTLGMVRTEEQTINEPTNTTISHGVISVIGRRRSMEDAVTIAPALVQVTKFHPSMRNSLSDELMSYDFFAVYDGHGSHRVAQRCKERLHHVVAEQLLNAGRVDHWESVMTTSFSKMEGEVAAEAEEAVESTALVVMVGKEEIVVANCGYSRAVLFCDGAALPLSRDRKPDGRDGVNVMSVPEVTVHKRSASEFFMVIASDGLWDVVSNETACDLVRKCCSGEVVSRRMVEGSIGNCAAASAGMLVELALARGSQDNISVIVVEFSKAQGNAGSSAT
ncbi:probable protein phosphatase 2C 8 [Chenopodium quinoa]|uniref:probable protein phosphatase 2C 8 n=1 Tax=Chenopodium quinoa TaxID=63459 RepID=UPI000B793C8A|nr:probable protein phosphatase 2C 8 [Chenopodium quinoa]